MPGERPETALIGGLVKKEGGPLAWCVSTGGIRADVVPVSPLPVAVANATGAYAVRGREAPHTGGGLLAWSHTRDAGELGTATTATALWIAQIADIIKFQPCVAGVVALLPVVALAPADVGTALGGRGVRHRARGPRRGVGGMRGPLTD